MNKQKSGATFNLDSKKKNIILEEEEEQIV